MRPNPQYALTDEAVVMDLLRQHPWCTVVSHVPGSGIVASHYPVLVDEDADSFTVFSHVGRPDDDLHELGDHEIAILVEGPHGYISPGWYGVSPAVPTWNFVVAHLYGTPQIVSVEENLRLMDRLVDFFEGRTEQPHPLHGTAADSEYARRIVRGTAAFRMRVERFEAKLKMSQDKPPEVVDRVIAGLRAPGPFRHGRLADYMERVNQAGSGPT